MSIDTPTTVESADNDTVRCACCERYVQPYDALSDEDGGQLCAPCATANYRYSDIQDCYVPRTSYVSLMNGHGIVSRDYADMNCYESETHSGRWFADYRERNEHDAEHSPNPDGIIYEYHSMTPMRAHGGWPSVTPRQSLCFGVELEMEHKDEDMGSDGQAALSEALGGCDGGNATGHYILMTDGSLSDGGVELITSPYTLDYHQKTFGWKALLDPVAKIAMSGAGTSRCGMHVHVNRAALSALTLGKMLVFVNSPACTKLIETIAQRDPEEWAKRYPKKIRDGRKATSDKYEALHLSSETVEFRIFRGNLRPDRVLKNIEFCHAITMYAQQTRIGDLEQPTLFVSWLAKNRSTYPNLCKFLSERSFMNRLSRAANAQSATRPSTIVATTEEI